MKILVLGSGGREHALLWKLKQSSRVERLYALPGSDAVSGLAELVKGDANRAEDVLAAVRGFSVDLVVVGPEAPMAAGVTDALRAAGVAVFGPSRKAAQLESSKIFAKEFMQRHGIPTARFCSAESLGEAEAALAQFRYPVVLKADGLAAGKGVVIAESEAEARQALRGLFSGDLVGGAGARVVLEEFLAGEELSLLALCDGERALPLVPAQDHKRLGEGDTGPNTGGMGAYSLDALLPADLMRAIDARILQPTLAGMRAEGAPFTGILYCGLMLTPEGPQVLEYNVRFGDPEAQAILPRFEGDLAYALDQAARGQVTPALLQWSPEPAACVVLAAEGYPGPNYAKGRVISGLEAAAQDPGVIVFHAGTARRDGQWITTGGRVLTVAARATTLAAALERCYLACSRIQFAGKQMRRDIGFRALRKT